MDNGELRGGFALFPQVSAHLPLQTDSFGQLYTRIF
jgi:hypothetical protein